MLWFISSVFVLQYHNMEKQFSIVLSVFVFLVLSSLFVVSAYNPIEWYTLHSHNRQEARIDNFWLQLYKTDSWIDGHLVYNIEGDKGYGNFTTFYDGYDYLNDYHSASGYTDVTNVVSGTYGKHFVGNTPDLILDGVEYKNVETLGFYCDIAYCEGEIYVQYIDKDFGMTWVIFMNGEKQKSIIRSFSSGYGKTG